MNKFGRTVFSKLRMVMVLFAASVASAAEEQPNIIFILADDLGYGDLGCYGHPTAKTPNIDQLAADGVRFTQHYSNGPECSPTRTAFLTGRYQQRAGGLECAIGTGNVGRYDDAIRLASEHQLGLPPEQTVIPGHLQKVGYLCGVFGKWHLGYEPHFNPIEHKWDAFFGYLGGNVHYFNHRETSDLHVLFRGRLPVYREGYMTHLITDDAVAFINGNSINGNSNGPFFLYVSHECPHFPFQGPSDSKKTVTADNWMTPDEQTYVAMLEDLDAEVGRLLAALNKAGAADNTIVVFASDNGGFAGAAHMGGLRSAKGTTFEGGIRVPLIVRWPEKIKAGTICRQPCLTFDLTRSFLEIAGAKIPETLEGDDIINHVVSNGSDYTRTLFWRGKRGNRVWSAVRHGDRKYVRRVEGQVSEDWIFDLEKDKAEASSLELPAVRSELKGLLAAWEEDVRPVR